MRTAPLSAALGSVVLVLLHATPARSEVPVDPAPFSGEISVTPDDADGTLDDAAFDPLLGTSQPRSRSAELRDAILARRPLTFCADRARPLSAGDRERWCPLAEDLRATCPAFADACATGDPATPAPTARPSPSSRAQPGAGAEALRVALLLAVAAAVAFLVRALKRNFTADDRSGPDAPPPVPAPVETLPDAPRLAPPGETDADLLIARAHALLSNGRYAEALEAARAALLRKLEQGGLLVLRESDTQADHLAGLRDQPALQAALRDVARQIDPVEFGGRPATRSATETVLARVTPIVRGIVGGVALLAAITSTCACDARSGAGRDGPDGYTLLGEIVAEHGGKLVPADLDGADTTGTLLVTSPCDDDTLGLLLGRADGGATIVLAAPGDETASRLHVRYGPVAPAGALVPHPTLAARLAGGSYRVPAGPTLLVEDRSAMVVATSADRPYVVIVPWGDGTVIITPDPALFANASLATRDNVHFVRSLLPAWGDLGIVDRWSNAGATTGAAAVTGARLWPAVLQLLIVVATWQLSRGLVRAGGAAAPQRSRRAFSDHVRALAMIYRRGRATRHVLGSYGAWVIDRLRERTLPGGRGSLADLAVAVARRTGGAEAHVRRLLDEAQAARADAARSRFGDLAALHDLEKLLTNLERTP